MDEDIPAWPTDHRLEEQLENIHKSLKELSLKNQDIWCTKCLTAGHSKDNCRQEYSRQDVRFLQTKSFCDIFQEHEDHSMKDCPFNMKNGKASWCAIYETKNNNMVDYHLNLKNRQNYHAVYQNNAIAQTSKQNSLANDQNGQRYDGQRYKRRYDN